MLHQVHMLRALAVFLVVLDHSCLAVSERFPIDPSFVQLAWLAGYFGVSIFFIISGLIMVQTTQREPPSRRAASAFLRRRLSRIVPMYYAATVLVIVLSCVMGKASSATVDPLSVLYSLVFVPALNAQGRVEPVLGQGWTLNYEMYFYILFSLFLLVPTRLRVRSLVALLGSSVLVAALLRVLHVRIGSAVEFIAAPIVLNFAVGLLLSRFGRPVRTSGSPWRATLIVLAATTCMAWLSWSVMFGRVGRTAGLPWQVDVIVYFVAAFCCWVCVIGNERLPSTGIQGLVAKMINLLATASYTTYLFHLFAIAAAVRFAMWLGLGAGTAFFSCVAISLVATVLLHQVVERPVTRWLKRRMPAVSGWATPVLAQRAAFSVRRLPL